MAICPDDLTGGFAPSTSFPGPEHVPTLVDKVSNSIASRANVLSHATLRSNRDDHKNLNLFYTDHPRQAWE